jgi:NADH-quinone oxidoreductase subunit M
MVCDRVDYWCDSCSINYGVGMILLYFLIILIIAGPIAWILGVKQANLARWISLLALSFDGLLLFSLWFDAAPNPWISEINLPWLPKLGASVHLAIDGMSLTLLSLTIFLGIVAIISSWKSIKENVGFFHCNILWLLTCVSALFMAMDLLLFYFAWELMLVPTYFLITIWGSERRVHAANKFFLFTQFGGLFLLAAIISLYCIHGQTSGHYTFNYEDLLNTTLSPAASISLMLGFVIAFFIKLPVIPFHSWAPDAYSEAPASVSLLLAGLLSKTGAYGLIRFVLPLFPEASAAFTPVALTLGLLGVFYGAGMAFAQTDLKRLISYSSISHMGFLLIGIFSASTLALSGTLIIMLAHGLSISALFIVSLFLQQRLHTRDLTQMGGLWTHLPILAAFALFFALASLGLPGLGNFVGEFLVVLGLYHTNVAAASIAAFGFVFSAIYILWMMQRIFRFFS